MRSPSEKFGDPVMNPVMDPSRFFLHRDIVGTPRGAVFFLCITFFFLFGGVFLAAGRGGGVAEDAVLLPPSPPNSPNREMVDWGRALLRTSSAALRSLSCR